MVFYATFNNISVIKINNSMIIIRVSWWVFYKWQELPTLPEHLGSPQSSYINIRHGNSNKQER